MKKEAHPIDILAGRRLRARRIILGLSQEEIGGHVGISFQQIQKYERGINRMGASRLYQFAKLLDVSVGFFFNEGEVEYEETSSNRESLMLLRSYNSITDKKLRKKILSLILAIEER